MKFSKISKYCHQCQMHSGTPGLFRFTPHNDMEFNDHLIIDICVKNKPVLYIVDEAAAFQSARFLSSMTAQSMWNALRPMRIDMYVGPQDVIVIDVGTKFTAIKFRANAKAMAINIEDVHVEAHNLIGKVKTYHYTLRREYDVIAADLGITVILKINFKWH